MKDIDLLNYKIGDKDLNGERITAIYTQNECYFFYEVRKNGVVNKLFKGDCDSGRIHKINTLIAEFSTYLTTRRKRRSSAQIIANAYSICLNGKVKDAKSYLHGQLKIKQEERITNNRLSYLKTCMIIVLLITVVAVFLHFINCDETNWKQLVLLVTVSAFGSYGGFISVSMKVNKLNVEIFNRPKNQIWLGISRVFISVLSSLLVFSLVKANIIFGFIDDINNKYIMYSMASLSGFSEYFIPNTLRHLESK